MKEKITLCGDNCIECPRFQARTEDELSKVAQLWYRVGWRETVVTNEEIRCTGCDSHKHCTYQLVDCTQKHEVSKCNQCKEFPCQKISDMLKRSKEYQIKCREICTEQEYVMLEKAFFNKENNLMMTEENRKGEATNGFHGGRLSDFDEKSRVILER